VVQPSNGAAYDCVHNLGHAGMLIVLSQVKVVTTFACPRILIARPEWSERTTPSTVSAMRMQSAGQLDVRSVQSNFESLVCWPSYSQSEYVQAAGDQRHMCKCTTQPVQFLQPTVPLQNSALSTLATERYRHIQHTIHAAPPSYSRYLCDSRPLPVLIGTSAWLLLTGSPPTLRDWRPRRVSLSRGCALVWLPRRKAL
jgi:hypothetical protein